MPTSIETRSRFTRMAGHLAPSRRTSDKWNEKTGAAICLNLLVLSLSIPLLVFGSYAGAAYRHAERSSYGGDPDESGAEILLAFTLSAAFAAILFPVIDIALYCRATLYPVYAIVMSIIMSAFYPAYMAVVLILNFASENHDFYIIWDKASWSAWFLMVLYGIIAIIYLTYLGYAAAAQKALNDRKSTTVAGHSTKPINLKIVAPQVDDNNV